MYLLARYRLYAPFYIFEARYVHNIGYVRGIDSLSLSIFTALYNIMVATNYTVFRAAVSGFIVYTTYQNTIGNDKIDFVFWKIFRRSPFV